MACCACLFNRYKLVGSSDQYDIVRLAFDLSWIVNIFLLGAKVYAFMATGSKAVAASLADSGVDILSQAVLSAMQYWMRTPNKDYPVGRARLEALGVIACSCIMSMSSLEVIQFSIKGERH